MTRQISRLLFYPSCLCLPYIVLVLGVGSSMVEQPTTLNAANLFGLTYIFKLLYYGVPYLLLGIIPTVLGLGLLVFYHVQSKRTTKRAALGWLGSVLFNLLGSVVLLMDVFENGSVWSLETPILLWSMLNVGLSSVALGCCLTRQRSEPQRHDQV